MKSILILPRIKVEGANSISGITYGFPAITHFLGYVHALSREFSSKYGLAFGGCGVICHQHQVKTRKMGFDSVFSLTRNPLTAQAKTPPFEEEGKTNFEISLIIECHFIENDLLNAFEGDFKLFLNEIRNIAASKRLAGGIIVDMASIDFDEIPSTEEGERCLQKKLRRMLMPGFVLMDRSEEFFTYLSENPSQTPLDALLDCYTLKYKLDAVLYDKKQQIAWERQEKPLQGWVVPLQVGYKAISAVYEKGNVWRARDTNVPFCFVEPIYSVGEWLGFHWIQSLEEIIWRQSHTQDLYLCSNNKKD